MTDPKFGEWVRGIFASDRNPQRDGMFVRVKVVTGSVNRGKYYECTDGKGNFWSYPPESTIRIPKKGAPTTQEEIDQRDAEWQKRYGGDLTTPPQRSTE